MLCTPAERLSFMADGNCPDCGGCIDDMCRGCGRRFCGGTYGWYAWIMPQDREPGSACDRCPEKIAKDIATQDGPRTVAVRCNADAGHTGIHHWDPYRAGRKETT